MNTKGEVLIQVQNLQKSFDGNVVLDGISTEIHKGEVVAIIGPSGSGKSTFLRSLNLMEEPTGGKILFENVDITDPKVDINRHRQKIGMVFQQFNLFPNMTVKENIMLAPVKLKLMSQSEASKKADELLARVGLPEKADTYPEMLSGGQKQRVAIARAMINHPSIILADEPTGNLDRKNSGEIMALLKLSNKRYHQTVVLITHDEKIALEADRIILIEDGKIVSQGKNSPGPKSCSDNKNIPDGKAVPDRKNAPGRSAEGGNAL